jgi:hypothetical protein
MLGDALPIRRRTILALLPFAWAAQSFAATGPTGPDRLVFRILRHGSRIGTHTVVVKRNGDALTADTDIEIAVMIGRIPLYRYSQRVTESWQGAVLTGIESTSDRGGRRLFMRGERGPDGLTVQGTRAKPYVAPADALPSTYWNRAMLVGDPARRPFIDVEDGKLLMPDVSAPVQDPVRTANGATVPARRITLTGDLAVELWYDMSDDWVALRLVGDDRSVVTYERE